MCTWLRHRMASTSLSLPPSLKHIYTHFSRLLAHLAIQADGTRRASRVTSAILAQHHAFILRQARQNALRPCLSIAAPTDVCVCVCVCMCSANVHAYIPSFKLSMSSSASAHRPYADLMHVHRTEASAQATNGNLSHTRSHSMHPST